MNIEMFEQLVKTRQSCRKFDGNPVEKEKIEKILELTCLAPSACNSQPWSFIVLNGDAADGIKTFLQPFGGNKFTSDCASFIAVVEEKANLMERLGERFLGQDFTAGDIGIAVAHMILAAESHGVSSCILGAFREEKLKAFLGVPSGKRLRLVIALGYAVEGYEIREKNRKEISIEYR